MSTSQVTAGLAVLVLLLVIGTAVLHRVKLALRKRLDQATAPDKSASTMPSPAEQAADAGPWRALPARWRPLPGNVLELADTGFQIRLFSNPGAFTYVLFSPEGAMCASGFELSMLKDCGERFAGYRQEFNAAPLELPAHIKR